MTVAIVTATGPFSVCRVVAAGLSLAAAERLARGVSINLATDYEVAILEDETE